MITKEQKEKKEKKETAEKVKRIPKKTIKTEETDTKKAKIKKITKKATEDTIVKKITKETKEPKLRTIKERTLKKEPKEKLVAPKVKTPEDTLANILKLMDKMDIKDILSIDVSEKTSICDTFIIGSIIANRQAKALVEALRAEYKHDGIFRVEGLNTDWIIVDMGDIIVHILTTEAREYYKLEEIWQ